MRTAIYIRVSTEEQVKEGYSISAQKQKLQAFCASQDWVVSGFYADEGISAKDIKRPELQKMLKDIEDGKIDCVLVYRLDRLTRSVFDLYKLLEVFDQYDCSFKSATEVYDTTTAMGRMFITIVAALAQWERENMAERIRFGQQEKARQGKYVSNRVPVGYALDKENWRLNIIEDEAKLVRKIFSLYKSGLGVNRVARHLNQTGTLTIRGNTWSDNTVMKILRNKTYKGAIEWDEIIVEDAHDAIIPKSEFDDVQQLIIQRAGTPPKTLSSDYIFSGSMRCLSCGGNLNGNYTNHTNKEGVKIKYKHYRCKNYLNGNCSTPWMVSEPKIEAAFLDYISKFEQISFVVEEEILRSKEKQKPKEDESDALKQELKQVEKKKKKFQFAWSDDAIEYDDFKARMSELRNREEEIKKELELLVPAQDDKVLDLEEIKAILRDVSANWKYLGLIEKKQFVGSIVKEIHYHKEKGHRYQVIIDSIDFV